MRVRPKSSFPTPLLVIQNSALLRAPASTYEGPAPSGRPSHIYTVPPPPIPLRLDQPPPRVERQKRPALRALSKRAPGSLPAPPIDISGQPSAHPLADRRFADLFLSFLKAEGAKMVFGIPGGLLHPFFDAVVNDDEMRLVVSKHEEGAAFMADGFARVSGQMAVCAGTAGPGSTNLLTGVACAFADGVPMLVVTGQATSAGLGRGAAQETAREDMDICAMFRPVTKYSTMVTSAESLGGHLRRAFRLALSGRPGPVHLNIPVDLWDKPVREEWLDPETYRTDSATLDRARVNEATGLLLSAERPVLLVGSGVGAAGAELQVRKFAELLGARVATTPRAKGLFPEDHPLSMGVFGFAGHRAARETILGSDVDVLMTIGASLNETTTLNWNPNVRANREFIQLDIDPDRIGRNYPVSVGLLGDAKSIMVEMIDQAVHEMRRTGPPNSTWHLEEEIPRGHEFYGDPAARTSDATPLTPQRWRCDLEEVLPTNAIVFSDIGGHMLFNVHDLCIRKGQRFVLNLGFGSMGHGTVAPIGAKLAAPDRPVFAIVGDGCFTMNGMDLLTAVEEDLGIIWIVENNNMHGITWHGSRMVGSKKPLDCVKYKRPLDVAGIARAMGLHAAVVGGPGELQAVVREALARGGPTLIEVRTDPSVMPPLGDRARTIAGFTKS